MEIIPVSIAIENLSDNLVNVELFKDGGIVNGEYIKDGVSIRAGGAVTYQELMYIKNVMPFSVSSICILSFAGSKPANYSDLVIRNNNTSVVLKSTKEDGNGNIITLPYFNCKFCIDLFTRIDINGLEPKSMLVILFYPSDKI